MRIEYSTPAEAQTTTTVPLFELRAAVVEREAQQAAAAEEKKKAAVDVEKPSTLDVFGAAFREGSGLGQLVYNQFVIQGDDNRIDTEFNPLTQSRLDGLAEHRDYLATARNRSEYDARVARIKQHNKDKITLQSADTGIALLAQAAAGLIDPLNLVPIVGGAAKVGMIGRAAITGAQAGGLLYAQDVVRDIQLDTKDANFLSALAGASTFSLIGGALGRAVPAVKSHLANAIGDAINGPGGLLHNADTLRIKPLTAESTQQVTNFATKAYDFIPGISGMESAQQLGLASKSAALREATLRLTTTNNVTTGALEGKALPMSAELLQTRSLGELIGINRALDDAKSSLGKLTTLDNQAKTEVLQELQSLGYVNLKDVTPDIVGKHFGQLVLLAANRTTPHSVAAVETVAAKVRDMYKRDWDQAVKLGLVRVADQDMVAPARTAESAAITRLQAEKEAVTRAIGDIGDDPLRALRELKPLQKSLKDIDARLAANQKALQEYTTKFDAWAAKVSDVPTVVASDSVPSWFTRRWDARKVQANKDYFINTVSQDIRDRAAAQGVALPDGASDKAALTIYNQITDIDGRPTGVDMLSSLTKTQGIDGTLARHAINISDSVAQRFLIDDISMALTSYKRAIATPMALKEALGFTSWDSYKSKVLTPRLAQELDELKAGYDMADPMSQKVVAKLVAEYEDTFKKESAVVEKLFKRLTGEAWAGSKTAFDESLSTAAYTVRSLSSMALLGGQIFSALGDTATIVRAHGLTPLLKNVATWLSSSEFRSMSKEAAERIGVAAELAMNGKHRAQANLFMTPFESDVDRNMQRGFRDVMNAATEKFQWLTGAKHWNDGIRATAANLSGDRVLNAAEVGWGALKKKERTYLATMGISEEELGIIAKGMKSASEGGVRKYGSFMHADTAKWTDADAARLFELAILKDSRTSALAPGIGTLPTWADNEAGRAFLQFKSFMFAMSQQFIRPALQAPDANLLQGLAVGVGLMMLSNAARDVVSGRDPDRPIENPFTKLAGVDSTAGPTERTFAMVTSALDRFGIFGLPYEIARIGFDFVEKTAQGRGAEAAVALAGVSPSYAFKAAKTAVAAGEAAVSDDKEMSDKELKAARSLLPGQNLLGLRPYEALHGLWAENTYWDNVKRNLGID